MLSDHGSGFGTVAGRRGPAPACPELRTVAGPRPDAEVAQESRFWTLLLISVGFSR